jgi:hypothetical protein
MDWAIGAGANALAANTICRMGGGSRVPRTPLQTLTDTVFAPEKTKFPPQCIRRLNLDVVRGNKRKYRCKEQYR